MLNETNSSAETATAHADIKGKTLTWSSAYAVNRNAVSRVESSSPASTGTLPSAVVLRMIFWYEGGIPVTVSSFALSVLIDHDGVMRRSADEFSETTKSGTSAIVSCMRLNLVMYCTVCRVSTLPKRKKTTESSQAPKLAVRLQNAADLPACDQYKRPVRRYQALSMSFECERLSQACCRGELMRVSEPC